MMQPYSSLEPGHPRPYALDGVERWPGSAVLLLTFPATHAEARP